MDAAKVVLEGMDKHSRVSRVSVLCEFMAKVVEEIHKVAEVEVIVYGSDLVVLAFCSSAPQGHACTHESMSAEFLLSFSLLFS